MSSGNSPSNIIKEPASHDSFMAYVSDHDSLMTLRHWAERQGYASTTVQQGGPDVFAQALGTARPPSLVVIDIDGHNDPFTAAARLKTLCGADSKIIITGSVNDVGFYRRIISLGIVDYLVKPLTIDTLHQTLQTAMRSNKDLALDVKEAKTIVVLGVRGGVGASTIAINMGWLLAHELGFKCNLLDLDLQFGTSALALDLQPGRGLRDIVSSPHRVDGLMIASSMVEESHHYSVLGGEEPLDEILPVDGEAIMALLNEIKFNYNYIIIDLPRHLMASQKLLLSSAHTVILATELSLAGIRDTRRIKSVLNTLGYTGHLMCLATRLSTTRPGQVDAAAFEKGAQIKIDLTIPEDIKSMTETTNSGKALGEVAKNMPITKSLMSLCQMIGAIDQAAPAKEQRWQQKLQDFIKKYKPGSST